MLFLVTTTTTFPSDFSAEKIAEISAQEKDRARELQEQGKWLHIWRVAGTRSSVIVFNVETAEELHTLLSSLAFFPYMKAEVTALCHHPNSIE